MKAQSPNGKIKQVDYIGLVEDVNFEGDGRYRQWHYHFFHGDIMHHLGSATEAPFKVTWNTEWIPDQSQSLQIAARIIDETGMIYFTQAIANLQLEREELSVELCKPYNIPQKWVTRKCDYAEKFKILGDLKKAVAYQLVWASWSPGYMNGITINNSKVFDKEGPKYQYYAHRVTLTDVSPLKSGENILMTAKTPKINGNTVHGMEVEWPGIMVLVQYDHSLKVGNLNSHRDKSYYLEQNYPNPFNPATTICYCLPKASNVEIKIYSTLGQKISTLVNAFQGPGQHATLWNGLDSHGSAVSSGTYLCALWADGYQFTGKMLLVR